MAVVYRVERKKGYVVMSNYHLKDKGLTLKSKGLLSMILSLPDDWNYSTRGLAAICKEGVDAITSALKELETAGYIIRNKMRDDKGRISHTEYVIYEQPPTEKEEKTQPLSPCKEIPDVDEPDPSSPYMENPYMDSPDMGSPITENPAQSIINKPSKKELNIISINNPSINQKESASFNQERVATTKQDRLVEKADAFTARHATQIDEIDAYRNLILENIEYESLLSRYSRERLDEAVEIMLETICSKREYIRVASDDFPREVVKSRLLKLDSTHIEYAFECIDKNTSKVHNIKAYLLTTLYNSPVTIDSYYRAEVNHDFYGS